MSLADVLPILCNNSSLECSEVFSCLNVNQDCKTALSRSCYHLFSTRKGTIKSTVLQQLQTVDHVIQVTVNEKSRFPNLTVGKLLLSPLPISNGKIVRGINTRSQKYSQYYQSILDLLNSVLTWLNPIDITLKFGKLVDHEIYCSDRLICPSTSYQQFLNSYQDSNNMEDMNVGTYFLNYCRILSQKYSEHHISIETKHQSFFLNSGWWSPERFVIF